VRLPAIVVVSSVLAGCGSSPPLHYYTLTEIPASGQPSVADNSTPIRIDRVTIPTELDRSQIIRRIDPTRLEIVEGDRWAAPLDETIRRVLSNDLASRLPPGAVANPNEPSIGEKRQSLAVDISEFYGDTTCAVTLRAAWSLKLTDSQALHGNEEIKAPPAGNCSGTSTFPAGMSQALSQLSDRIAAAVARKGG
jgi:uncharacterized lipoprotein YmbA